MMMVNNILYYNNNYIGYNIINTVLYNYLQFFMWVYVI